ncbi:hypothetical protein CE91St28_12930 [Pyramidobacter piscolens]|nr:hypothetical protein CE91St28_12930 [Pyramidobacter piscolens]
MGQSGAGERRDEEGRYDASPQLSVHPQNLRLNFVCQSSGGECRSLPQYMRAFSGQVNRSSWF